MEESTQEDIDDVNQDVELLKENSAWDLLGERIQQAAERGDYIDLSEETNETDGKAVSAQQARGEFQKLKKPVNPATIIQPESIKTKKTQNALSASTTRSNRRSSINDGPSADSELSPLWYLIDQSVELLKEARESLMQRQRQACPNVSPQKLMNLLGKINVKVVLIQSFITANSELVSNSSSGIKRVQALNMLVHKANIFINEHNRLARSNNTVLAKADLYAKEASKAKAKLKRKSKRARTADSTEENATGSTEDTLPMQAKESVSTKAKAKIAPAKKSASSPKTKATSGIPIKKKNPNFQPPKRVNKKHELKNHELSL